MSYSTTITINDKSTELGFSPCLPASEMYFSRSLAQAR